MIPNVVEGSDFRGLLRYLLGPGRAEEHVRPHLVAGDELLLAWHGDGELNPGHAGEIAGYLDAPRKLHGVEVRSRVHTVDAGTGDREPAGWKELGVWHCSLSLAPGEGLIGDDRWQEIATGFADAMGLTEACGKAPVRWVAVHHGPSKSGLDHVHIAASMVREDGTRWEGRHYSKRNAQAACRDLEVAHGLVRVEGPGRGVSERGTQPGEARRAAAAGLTVEETVPRDLAVRVRAAALASTSEAEFVRRARADGIVVKPRYAPGSTQAVVGYKVALPPSVTDGAWRFYAGGKLGRDLALPELRKTWPTPDEAGQAAAVAEWAATRAGTAAVETSGREKITLATGAGATAGQRLAAFNRSLASLDHTDTAGWARAARQGAGAMAAAARSTSDPGQARALARAARVLARSARHLQPPGTAPQGRDSAMGAALVLLQRRGPVDAGLGREVLATARAVRAHHRALGHEVEAARLGTALGALQAFGIAGAAQQALARAAERVVGTQVDGEEDRAWEDLEHGHDRDTGLGR